MATTLLISLFLLTMNTICFLVWAVDKERARRRTFRISERRLLTLAAFGGLGGAVLGHVYFGHKLKKRSFNNALCVIVLVECFGVLWILTHS